MQCKKCGFDNRSNANYCSQCGHPLEQALGLVDKSQKNESISRPRATSDSKIKGRNLGKVLFAVPVLLLICVIGAGLVYWILTSNSTPFSFLGPKTQSPVPQPVFRIVPYSSRASSSGNSLHIDFTYENHGDDLHIINTTVLGSVDKQEHVTYGGLWHECRESYPSNGQGIIYLAPGLRYNGSLDCGQSSRGNPFRGEGIVVVSIPERGSFTLPSINWTAGPEVFDWQPDWSWSKWVHIGDAIVGPGYEFLITDVQLQETASTGTKTVIMRVERKAGSRALQPANMANIIDIYGPQGPRFRGNWVRSPDDLKAVSQPSLFVQGTTEIGWFSLDVPSNLDDLVIIIGSHPTKENRHIYEYVWAARVPVGEMP